MKYNQINHELLDHSRGTESFPKELIKHLHIIMKKETLDISGVNYYETKDFSSNHFIFDHRTNVLLAVSLQNYTKKFLEVTSQSLPSKVYNFRNYNYLFIRRKPKPFKPQIFGLSSIIAQISNLRTQFNNAREFAKSGDAYLWFLDIITMILNIREGYLTPNKIFTTILSLYTLSKRITNQFTPQFLDNISFDSLHIFFSMIGLPSIVVNTLKNFSLLTGKRLFSSSIILSLISSLYSLFKHFLTWILKHVAPNGDAGVYIALYIENILDTMFGSILCYDKIKRVTEIYSEYASNPSIILEAHFRNRVSILEKEVTGDPIFDEYVSNHDNRHFKEMWSLFKSNLVKYVDTFTVSQKNEPICFVFEGAPGSGKSVIMNSFVEYLKENNRSVYVHSVPPAEGGKDFYDDYENQEVFVMDDVGQQAKSQWRTIINFVSPVKFPLECASANKKNTKFFNSKIILCTTNLFSQLSSFTSSDCIAEPEALFRRVHLIKINRTPIDTSFLQDLQYMKFNHLTHHWESKFIFHNSGITLPTSIKSQPQIKILTYMRMLLDRIEINEDINRQATQMSSADLAEIGVDTLDFEPQFGLSDLSSFLSNLKSEWLKFTFGKEIFDEWFSSMLNATSSIGSDISSYFTQLFLGVKPDNYIGHFLNSEPSDILGSSSKKDSVYRSLALKYHPDKFEPNANMSREDATLIFLIVSLAKEYYNDSEAFNTRRSIILRDKTEFIKTFNEYSESNTLGCRHRAMIYSSVAFMKHLLMRILSSISEAHVIIVFVLIYYAAIILLLCFSSGTNDDEFYEEKLTTDIRKRWNTQKNKVYSSRTFHSQTQVDDTISKFCKFVVVYDKDGTPNFTHGIVSGNRILLNTHMHIENPTVSVFNSYDHYESRHAELELIKLTRISDFPSCDLTVYQFKNCHSVYPNCDALFRTTNISPIITLCSSLGKVPLVFEKNIFLNDVVVEYSSYKRSFTHPVDSGLITPIQGEGLCGSFMYNASGDIVAVHVAGDGDKGFCVIPSRNIAEMIRKEMSYIKNLSLQIDTTIKPNFSGARLVYPAGDVTTTYPTGTTKIVPSILHIDNNIAMQELVNELNSSEFDDCTYTAIDRRGPPLIKDPVKIIKETSLKSFKNQGGVSDKELMFIKNCIKSLMPVNFSDLTDEQVAFGDKDFSALNKDSSNGYGHIPGKESYIDYENKIILPSLDKELCEFRNRITTRQWDYKDYLTKECFKVDELRNEQKRETPRTIRVMPVTHIWYTKKIFGNLAQYFKDHKHETGIGLGFNPFVDFDILYKKLKTCHLTGDIDAAKWDGSLVALIMEAILEVMFDGYTGEFRYMQEFLTTTIIRTFVLVADELYMTTHGLPSGTWLTFLLNSLFNRALDALVIYRHRKIPTIEDFQKIVTSATGDDKVFGVPLELSEDINLLSYKKVFSSLGMVCTNGDKTEITNLSQPLEKMTYLKRHFKFHPILKRYMGPLSLNTIVNMPQWIDKSKDNVTSMNGKMRAVQIEAYIHSPALFRKFTLLFNNELGHEHILFTENEVVAILNDPYGYEKLLQLSGKYNFSR